MFFVEIAVLIKPLIKIASVLVRVLFSLVICYTDLVTDVLVCKVRGWCEERSDEAYPDRSF